MGNLGVHLISSDLLGRALHALNEVPRLWLLWPLISLDSGG